MYQPIDQIKTGLKLKMLLKAAGYDVKYIQEYLHLSCPQSIYRWFKGKVLPSVEHLCALSKLLNVHMFSSKEPNLHTVSCCEAEAELYVPFNHMEYEETLNKARSIFCVYERRYGEEKYWSDLEYLFDWTEGEFM